MDTSEVERIRARVADEYWQAMDEAMHAAHGRQDGMFYDMVMDDLRTLLAHLDAQAAELARLQDEIANRTHAADLWLRKHEDAELEIDRLQAIEAAAGEVDARWSFNGFGAHKAGFADAMIALHDALKGEGDGA